MADLRVPMGFTHLDAGADKKSWGKRHSNLRTPKVPQRKIIFLHRDPRDTVVSYFHEMTKRQPLLLSQRLQYVIFGKMPPPDLDGFVRSSRFGIEKAVVFNLNCAEQLRSYPLAYEDLSADTVGTLISVLDYLGHRPPLDEIRSAVAKNSLENMRIREASGELAQTFGTRLLPANPDDPNSFKVRRGKIDNWRDEMVPYTQEFANELLARYRYFERIQELTQRNRMLLVN